MTVRRNQMVHLDAYLNDAAHAVRSQHLGITPTQSAKIARAALAAVLPQIVNDLASDIDLADAYPGLLSNNDAHAQYERAQQAAEAWLSGLADELESQR